MYEKLEEMLLESSKTMVDLVTLEHIASSYMDVDQFRAKMDELIKIGFLSPVLASKPSGKSDGFFNRYRINKSKLNYKLIEIINGLYLKLDPRIRLDAYYGLDWKTFKRDEPYIHKINAYLSAHEKTDALLYEPELAFLLTDNKKWFEDKTYEGYKVLNRLGLLGHFKVHPKIDPVAFSLDLNKVTHAKHKHLIVENKSAYLHLQEVIDKSPYTAILYGAGNMIPSSIRRFKEQLRLKGEEEFYYFGDLDREGIRIWYSLNLKLEAKPALELYTALLTKKWVRGKESQKGHEQQREAFYAYFEQNHIEEMSCHLSEAYIPQEALTKDELQRLISD
ncbi:MAG: hypothetical protein CVU98_11050 [Firmicutes bacterium HGW-Firmicutes-3]|jgi:hypothetical protein|nr:MAG: hypothetical protein CVU98_11050 [Firmicutes bacterium HGW-Firmicutes-3]